MAAEEKSNYSNRRKTFHFSQKNDDLLQYLNKKDTKEQSAFIMGLIREAMENEGKVHPLQALQEQLAQALEEIELLKKALKNPLNIQNINSEPNSMDEEVVNRLFQMLSEIKRENTTNFNVVKDQLKNGVISTEVVESDVFEEDTVDGLSDEEFDDLFDDDIDF